MKDDIKSIKITVLDKDFYIEEPSFYFCKNLIKNLNNTENSEKVFNKVVKQLTGEVLNLQEKFLFLLELRGLILGNEIEITSNKNKMLSIKRREKFIPVQIPLNTFAIKIDP